MNSFSSSESYTVPTRVQLTQPSKPLSSECHGFFTASLVVPMFFFSLKIRSHDLRKYERLRVRYQELRLRDAELELNASAVVSGPAAAATITTTSFHINSEVHTLLSLQLLLAFLSLP
jgi:hypothetical protein